MKPTMRWIPQLLLNKNPLTYLMLRGSRPLLLSSRVAVAPSLQNKQLDQLQFKDRTYNPYLKKKKKKLKI
jgi:hypothetical protein